ncbi:hypothetical protein [Vibrio splendidus]|uniref:hypothetical protein n=1 Tax=Vibrio splendidus TaxID=29497 RepID=UPI0002F606FF|nr:hypothetical protein [Vibrio splendidus]
MARSETVISVFVASPGDVMDERNSLESIINELNKTWSKTLNLRLELVRWESDVRPGFGQYAQDVINKQVNDEYDVFIALFWSKVGSPTNIAESGTIEEFDRAYQKYCNDPDSVDIMIYFKDEPIPPSQMDTDQLKKIQSLKSQLGEQGGLYWSFDRAEDFENLLRSHLSSVAQSWSKKLIQLDPIEQEQEQPKVSDPNGDLGDDYGLFDYLDIYDDRMSDMASTLEIMTDATDKVGAQFNRRTSQIESITSGTDGIGYDQKEARKVIKFTSDDLTRYANIIDSQVDSLSDARTQAFDALSKGIAISIDMQPDSDSIEDLKVNLRKMRSSAQTSEDGLVSFRDSIVCLPKLNVQLNKAKRAATRSLDRTLDEIRKTIQSVTDVLDIIDKLLVK